MSDSPTNAGKQLVLVADSIMVTISGISRLPPGTRIELFIVGGPAPEGAATPKPEPPAPEPEPPEPEAKLPPKYMGGPR